MEIQQDMKEEEEVVLMLKGGGARDGLRDPTPPRPLSPAILGSVATLGRTRRLGVLPSVRVAGKVGKAGKDTRGASHPPSVWVRALAIAVTPNLQPLTLRPSLYALNLHPKL